RVGTGGARGGVMHPAERDMPASLLTTLDEVVDLDCSRRLSPAPYRHRLDREDDARGRHRVTVQSSVEPDLSLPAAIADRKMLVAADAEFRAARRMKRNDFGHVTTPFRSSATSSAQGIEGPQRV